MSQGSTHRRVGTAQASEITTVGREPAADLTQEIPDNADVIAEQRHYAHPALLRQALGGLRLTPIGQEPLHPPMDPADLDAIRAQVQSVVRGQGAHTLGAYGDLDASIDLVSKHLLMIPDWHPRRDWDDDTADNLDLDASIRAIGLQERLLVTPLIEGDPGTDDPSPKRLLVIDGARRVGRIMRNPHIAKVRVEVRINAHTGEPLSAMEALMLYLSIHQSRRTLRMPQLLYAMAYLKRAFHLAKQEAEAAGDDGIELASHTFPTGRELARRLGVGLATIQRALYITDEHPTVVDAVATGAMPSTFVLELPRLIGDADKRAEAVQQAVEYTQDQLDRGLPAPTPAELLEYVSRRMHLLPPGNGRPPQALSLQFALPVDRTHLRVAQLSVEATGTQILGAWLSDGLQMFESFETSGAHLPQALREWLSLADSEVVAALERLILDPELRDDRA